MAHTNLSHRRTHNILLISRLLNQREGASPLTLVLDSLEQPARPLVREYVRRANLSKTHTILLAFETPHTPQGVDTFIPCWNKLPQQITQTTITAISAAGKRCIVLIDSVMALSKASVQLNSQVNLTAFLMSLLQPQQRSVQASVSLVVVYHLDIPLSTKSAPYSPTPLSVLEYLATTVISTHSLSILLAEKQAREKSLANPSFGLAEGKEGLLVGSKPQLRSMRSEDRGIVLQLEHRRKSGRGVLEWYFLPSRIPAQTSAVSAFREVVSLFDDHALFRKVEDAQQDSDQELAGVTFDLGLTDRQRLERDGVVLPYFDAQKEGGGGEGGRILYDMGAEDDFDEEEDEI